MARLSAATMFGSMATKTILPISFNALAIDAPGSPVRQVEKTIHSLCDDEVLIRVSHASINKMDPLLARRNIFDLPAPYTLGFDFSGEVVELGVEGEIFVGDHVFGRVARGGSFAEYVVAKKGDVMKRGPVPAPEASTFGIAYLTAYESVVITGKLETHAGKTVYVAGAAGGVGHFAAQLAKLCGLIVIGSAGKQKSLDLLERMKLDHVVDYSKQSIVEEIMRITGGKGVDLVYDSTGAQASYLLSAAVVAAGGEYIRLGTPQQLMISGSPDMTAVVEARGAKMTIADLGRYARDPVYVAQMPKVVEGMRRAVTWYGEGKLRPFITLIVPFDASALQEAFDAFVAGTNNVGKVVVEVRS
jgi:NADPH2:quinone reductase